MLVGKKKKRADGKKKKYAELILIVILFPIRKTLVKRSPGSLTAENQWNSHCNSHWEKLTTEHTLKQYKNKNKNKKYSFLFLIIKSFFINKKIMLTHKKRTKQNLSRLEVTRFFRRDHRGRRGRQGSEKPRRTLKLKRSPVTISRWEKANHERLGKHNFTKVSKL